METHKDDCALIAPTKAAVGESDTAAMEINKHDCALIATTKVDNGESDTAAMEIHKNDCANNSPSESVFEVVSVSKLLIDGLGHILTKWVQSASPIADKPAAAPITDGHPAAGFFSRRPPSINAKDYLKRIHHFFNCSDACYVHALVYIRRIVEIDSAIIVCNLSVHRLLFVAMMLAAKFHDDFHYKNTYYATVGGMHAAEVNALEVQFLKRLKWNTSVSLEEYQICHKLVYHTHERPFLRSDQEPEPEP
jgi:hypothetical protein